MTKAEDDGRFLNIPWEPKIDVQTAWDLGIDDATAIVFYQTVGNEIRIIDYYEANGEGLPHFINVLKSKPYVYGAHHAPWDIEVRELSTGKSRRDTARSLGIIFSVGKKVRAKEEAIEQARQIISKCWFDKNKCEKLISGLRNYHKEFDDKLGVYKKTPVHNWASHSADAFMQLAMDYRQPRTSPLQTVAEQEFEFF